MTPSGKQLGKFLVYNFTRIWGCSMTRGCLSGGADVIAAERRAFVRDYGNGVAATSFGGRQDFPSLLKNNENPL